MAENPGENKSSKGIGELFVEFGTKGFPTILKQLNGISASFLLGKNAANQFAQTLTKPMKEAGNAAVEVGKLANSLDTSYKNVQKLQYYFKSKNVGEGLVGDLGNLQTTLRDVLTGYTDLPANFTNAFAKTGHLLEDYTDDFNDILRLVKDIQNADLTRSERNQIFDFLGMSRDWGYLFDRGDFNLSDALALPDDVIEKNIQTAENLKELDLAFQTLKDLLVGEFIPPFTDFVKWFTGVTKSIIDNKENIKQSVEAVSPVADSISIVSPFAGVGMKATAAATTATINYQKNKKDKKNKSTGFASNVDYEGYLGELPELNTVTHVPDFMNTSAALNPSNIANLTQNINITNQNSITGDNPQEIRREIASINSQDLQYTQAELTNLPGL